MWLSVVVKMQYRRKTYITKKVLYIQHFYNIFVQLLVV